MAKHSKLSDPGYIFMDHRASPGVTDDELKAAQSIMPPGAGQGVFEADFVSCPHCQVMVVINHQRTRPRPHCVYCDRYICDGCDFIRSQPGYIHKTAYQMIDELAESRHKDLNIKEI